MINFCSENIIESIDAMAITYSTSTYSFLRAIGLSSAQKELEKPTNRKLVLKRLSDIDSLLNAVRPWFTSDSNCWSWFMNEKLIAFADLTPSKIVGHYQDRGINALRVWIDERKAGNFQ